MRLEPNCLVFSVSPGILTPRADLSEGKGCRCAAWQECGERPTVFISKTLISWLEGLRYNASRAGANDLMV